MQPGEEAEVADYRRTVLQAEGCMPVGEDALEHYQAVLLRAGRATKGMQARVPHESLLELKEGADQEEVVGY